MRNIEIKKLHKNHLSYTFRLEEFKMIERKNKKCFRNDKLFFGDLIYPILICQSQR